MDTDTEPFVYTDATPNPIQQHLPNPTTVPVDSLPDPESKDGDA